MLLSKDFKSDTPVLPDVVITEPWAYYDGPLFGVCKINGKEFFFIDIIFDIWRYYEDDTSERLWAIYAVYDIDIEKAKKYIDENTMRTTWESEIRGESNCIGIFWNYKYANNCKDNK